MRCLSPSALALAFLALCAGFTPPQDGGEKPYKINQRVREEQVFEDLDGEEHLLFEEFEDRVLILSWWSLKDPSCRVYEKRLTELQAEFEDDDVQVVLIESNNDEIAHPRIDLLARIRKHIEKTELSLTLWIDRDNTVADDFDALCANHVYVLDRKRHLRYMGGIDDDPANKKKPEDRRTWLRDAVVEVIDGEKPEVPITRPKGRRINRVKKDE